MGGRGLRDETVPALSVGDQKQRLRKERPGHGHLRLRMSGIR